MCRPTGLRPVDITPENANDVWKRLYGQYIFSRNPRFKKDEAVRIALENPVFRKGYLPTFTDEIFYIDRVIVSPRPPNYYYLRDYKGERLKGRFYEQDFAKVREDSEATFRIEKVLQKRHDKSGQLEFKVRFIGYPKETYWIKESDLVA